MSMVYTIVIAPIELLIEVCFVLFYKIFHNLGFSIVAISAFVTIVTLPLYHVAEQLQKRERDQRLRLQPQIDRIKSTFKGDEQYMMLSTLYRQSGYHPLYALRGSVGLFIQVPFFIAAYHFLSHLLQLQGSRFLFIPDLGQPDGLLTIGGVAINVLPIVMTLVNILASIVYTKGFPIRDKVQLYGIAGLFLVLLYQSPSALVLYWTLNNVFSLVKALFYKLKHPRRILISLVIVGSAALVFLVLTLKPDLSPAKRMVVIGGGVLLGVSPFLLLLVGWLSGNILQPFTENRRQVSTIYLLSALLLFVVMGVVVPANLIGSSPIEFSFTGSVANPLSYIRSNAALFAGITLLWPLVIYGISPRKTRGILALALMFLVFSVLVNVFMFGGQYGFVSNLFLFDDPSVLNASRIQTIAPLALVLLALVLATIVLQTKRAQWVSSLLVILLLSSGASGAFTMVQINKEYKIHALNLEENKQMDREGEALTPIMTLSRTEKNVVVIFLDRAINSFFPLIVEQFPYLKEQYSGFAYYPNTVSYGRRTISGVPPLMGGYEYTPERMNERDTTKMVDKHNEATLVLPLLFQREGYRATVFNPPLPNHKWSDDFTAFKPYPEIGVFHITGAYSSYYTSKQESFNDSEVLLHDLISDRLPLYVVLKSLFPAIRSLLYDDGTYFLIQESPENLDAFIDSFAILHYLEELTEIDDVQGSYVFLGNDTTHVPIFLQAPDYIPIVQVTNFSNPLQSDSAYGKMEQRHYHANAAAILQIGEWLDYLKRVGVYDNTRIAIVADHGYDIVTPAFKDFAGHGKAMAKFNALLLMKDFDSQGDVVEDPQLMTNADVPIFAVKDIIKDPLNPFTMNMLEAPDKTEGVNIYRVTGVSEKSGGTQFSLVLPQSYSVRDDIHIESNWVPIGD